MSRHAAPPNAPSFVQAVYRRNELDSPWPLKVTTDGPVVVVWVPGGSLRLDPLNADKLWNLLAVASEDATRETHQ